MPSVLTSWKEISDHLGKGVRTVQRWEIELGLPVHRSNSGSHRSIFAVPEELDAWACSHPRAPNTVIVGSLRREIACLREEISGLRERLEQIERAPRVCCPPEPYGDSRTWAQLVPNDLREARIALRATIRQSQKLREESQTVRAKLVALRFKLRTMCDRHAIG